MKKSGTDGTEQIEISLAPHTHTHNDNILPYSLPIPIYSVPSVPLIIYKEGESSKGIIVVVRSIKKWNRFSKIMRSRNRIFCSTFCENQIQNHHSAHHSSSPGYYRQLATENHKKKMGTEDHLLKEQFRPTSIR